MNVSPDLIRHHAEFRRALANHKYEQTDEGILFPAQGVLAVGMYDHMVNGEDLRFDKNLITTEGLNHILDTVLHGTAQVATWYMGISSGNVTPLATWTAANYTANATEITSGTEGYTEASRPAYTEAAASGGSTTNAANRAGFTIATATAINVWGAALLSSSVKGGTSGALLSASKFTAVRTLYNADILSVGYTLTLTST